MRLIHTKTGRFHVVDDPRTIRYAILSHVWARVGEHHYPEPTFQDIRRIQETHDAQNSTGTSSVLAHLPEKIRRFCEVAAEHDYDYAWADMCCIDKTSSSELSEALNSMYDWYRYAGICYVFLHDVPTVTTAAELETRGSAFRNSRWHRRGWTLQELLAPSVVVFLSSEWRIIGTKRTLADLIQSITRIDRDVLTFRRPLEQFSVACRMSWAASRETSREEDEAYSLMGIFGVNMPTTYGEGRYAFIRLQEEIMKHISDQTIFAWGAVLPEHNFSFHPPRIYRPSSDRLTEYFSVSTSSPDQFLLASSPKDFRYSSGVVSIPWDEFMRILRAPSEMRPTYTTTSYGVRARLPLLGVRAKDSHTNAPTCIALLACKDAAGNVMTLLLRSQPQRPDEDFFVGAVVGSLGSIMRSMDNIDPFSMMPAFSQHYYRTASLSPGDMDVCSQRFHPMEVYIPHRPSLAAHSLQRDVPLHSALRSTSADFFELRIPPWSQDLLKSEGYRVVHHPGTRSDPYTIDITSMSSLETVSIHVRRCDCGFAPGVKERFMSVDVFMNRPDRSPGPMHLTLHKANHDSHVQSWTFRNGAALKEFHLKSSTGRRVSVRLSLTKSTEPQHIYILGVELWATQKEDVKRERERMMAKVEPKTIQDSPQARSRRLGLATQRSAPAPLQRTRSSSLPPGPLLSIQVSSAPSEGSQKSDVPSPTMLSPTDTGISLPTPLTSASTSRRDGVVGNPWDVDSSNDAASWHGIGYTSRREEHSQMEVDTPGLSPVDVRIQNLRPPPLPPNKPYREPSSSQQTSSLDVDHSAPSNPQYVPMLPTLAEAMWDEPRSDDYLSRNVHAGLRSQRRQTLPTAHVNVPVQAAPPWSGSWLPFRALSPPQEEDEPPAETPAPLPTRETRGGSEKRTSLSASPKVTGKRRFSQSDPSAPDSDPLQPTPGPSSKEKRRTRRTPRGPSGSSARTHKKIIPMHRGPSGSSVTSEASTSAAAVPPASGTRYMSGQGAGSNLQMPMRDNRRGGRDMPGQASRRSSQVSDGYGSGDHPAKRKKT
ncbi:hypothetical protein OH77DRAFT_311714 [Trametes cingulata]|nr:hypothetical protein OH77DRAFT_311714 [Trametes cingulata]